MGYQACLYNPVSYPNRAPTQLELVTQHRKTSEKLPGKSRGNIDRNKRDTLHNLSVSHILPVLFEGYG